MSDATSDDSPRSERIARTGVGFTAARSAPTPTNMQLPKNASRPAIKAPPVAKNRRPPVAGRKESAFSDKVPQTRPEHIAARIRLKIILDQLVPGQRIPERTLATEFGVSRTPMREALKILSSEGLIQIFPNRGAIVTALDPSEVLQLMELLAGLEALAASLACKRATDEEIRDIRATHYEMMAAYTRNDYLQYFRLNQAIHKAIALAAHNRYIAEQHAIVNARVYRIRSNLKRERWSESVAEHAAIIDALERRDGTELSRLMSQHLGKPADWFGESTDVANSEQSN